MTTIKAREITPGMVIEWTDRDMFKRTTAREYDSSMRILRSVQGVANFLPPDTDVEVIAAQPAPTEPEALGARVKAGGCLFLRVDETGCSWLEVTAGVYGFRYTWRQVNEFGPVTVIDGNPSWEVEAGEDAAPEQWDDVEEALKHCDKVVDRLGDKWHYEDSVLHLTTDGGTRKWQCAAHFANYYGPFCRA